jgi:hypothetical protein
LTGLCLNAQQAPPQTPTPAPPPEEASAQPGDKAPPSEEKENIWAGYKKTADLARAAWLELEAKTLPLVEKLGQANACANQRPIAKYMEALRTAAREWIAAYRVYLDKWSEYTQQDVEQQRKFWADMDARKSDIPALITGERDTLKEYRRRQADLSADDAAARKEYADLIQKTMTKIEQLQKADDESKTIDKQINLSHEYWDAKLENIKKDGELVDAALQSYEKQYDLIIQQWKTACTGKTAPTTLKDLGLDKKK